YDIGMRTLCLVLAVLGTACSSTPNPEAPTSTGSEPPPGEAPSASPQASAPASAPASAAPSTPPSASAPAQAGPTGPAAPYPGQPDRNPLLGKLGDAEVQATLSKNYAVFDPCYPESFKKKGGSLKVQVTATMGPGGDVNSARVSKSSKDAKADA